MQCAPALKLYAIYLVDSIVKNIGAPYTTLFAGNMPEVSLKEICASKSGFVPGPQTYTDCHLVHVSHAILTNSLHANTLQVFANVWLAAPQAQASLRKVLNTWTGIFPDAMLAAVSARIRGPMV